MPLSRALIALLLLTAVLIAAGTPGCSDDAASSDAPPAQGDGGGSDQPWPARDRSVETTTDLSPQPDAPRWAACSETGDLAPFALAEGYCLVGRASLSDEQVTAVAVGGGRLWTLSAAEDPWGQIAAAPSSALDQRSLFFGFAPEDTDGAFTGDYLALSPAGQVAAGYTFGASFEGAVVLVDAAGQLQQELAQATANFDALFWDEQRLLVNGAGLGAAQQGQGVYLHQPGEPPRKLIDEMGLASGFLARGPELLFAGGYFSSGNQLLAFTREEIEAAIAAGTTLTSADGDLIFAGDALDATTLGDDLLVSTVDELWAFVAVQRISIAREGDTVAPLDVLEVIGGGQGQMIRALAGAAGHLGLLLTGPTGEPKGLALVRER